MDCTQETSDGFANNFGINYHEIEMLLDSLRGIKNWKLRFVIMFGKFIFLFQLADYSTGCSTLKNIEW